MNIIEHVARRMQQFTENINWESSNKQLKYIMMACEAIKAMRDLVKMTPDGCQVDDIILNEYIDKALK